MLMSLILFSYTCISSHLRPAFFCWRMAVMVGITLPSKPSLLLTIEETLSRLYDPAVTRIAVRSQSKRMIFSTINWRSDN